ncbi:ABC transporter ATP-binding protein [Microbacterium sp. NPDC056569]|uniref:ABC transporter ATP-binding protein n=1 Tax=Microbacterium sp. NPDC056569 TaxID=3345867 RepID=UPI00366EA8F0
MTASLPVPNDIDPEEPDRHSSARVVRLADTVSPAPDKPRRPPRKPRSEANAKAAPRKKRTPAASETKPEPAPQADPGPPPPLPSDLELAASAAAGIVVPPRPPLPAPDDEAGFGPAEAASVEDPAPVADAAQGEETAAEPEPEPAAAPAAGIKPLAETAAVVDAEPVVESAPVAEPAAVAEPTPVVEPDAAPAEPRPAAAPAEREPAPAPGPVPAATLEPETEAPGPVPAATLEPETEAPAPVLSAALAAEPVPTLDPEALTAAVSLDAAAASPAAASGDALVLRGVTKRFGSTHAVDGIDLTIPAGTFYGLVGPNGAGKTTTLSMIAGLLEPDRGTIHVGGVDAAAKPLAAKKLMGVLPDRLRTFDRLTGRQLLYYYGVLRKLPPAVVESRTADLARAFDLEDALGRSVSDYSAGMLKKVMLAGALIHSPRLLVLDEPFEAVDPVSSAIILDILSTYVAHGGTVILSSHGMDLVERVCTRVAVIVAGQVLAEGTVDEVRGELTLEQRFVELAGGLSDVEGLEWLHTFSD